MENHFDNHVKELYERADKIINNYLREKLRNEKVEVKIPEDFKVDFFSLIDRVNLNLMEDEDNFYGYFLLQMGKEISFDISSPSAVNFRGAKYVIYFNPLIFLNLNINQMESSIRHEILHILSMHLVRGRDLKGKYSPLTINMAMDIVVNKYLDCLPHYATTLEWVNLKYSLKLLPYKPFEYYAEELQIAIDLLEAEDDTPEEDNRDTKIKKEFDPDTTHDLWEASDDMDEKTLEEFTVKYIESSQRGAVSAGLAGLIEALNNSRGELPWNLYLSRLMGTVESNKKKTITRRNRRQPDRLDIKGELRTHKANIAVALDISGSISDEEFKQAIEEVLSIVKNYNHEITIIECDDDIRRVYKVKSAKDIKERTNLRGGTRFSPVFKYANSNNFNLLVYFTDGMGEKELKLRPQGYKILWVISGRGDKLSIKEPYGMVKRLNNIVIKDNAIDLSDIVRDGYSMNNQERI